MRIKELREAAGITQVGFADNMGVSQGTVSCWENETVLPRTRDLPLMAKVLKRTISELFVQEDLEAG